MFGLSLNITNVLSLVFLFNGKEGLQSGVKAVGAWTWPESSTYHRLRI